MSKKLTYAEVLTILANMASENQNIINQLKANLDNSQNNSDQMFIALKEIEQREKRSILIKDLTRKTLSNQKRKQTLEKKGK